MRDPWCFGCGNKEALLGDRRREDTHWMLQVYVYIMCIYRIIQYINLIHLQHVFALFYIKLQDIWLEWKMR